MKTFLLYSVVLLISACSRNEREYDAWASCQGLNLRFGMDAYEECIEEQKWFLSDGVQREEFKRLQQFQEDKKITD